MEILKTIKYIVIGACMVFNAFMANAQTKFNRNIPNDAHQKMGQFINNGIDAFSFAPNGGWLLVDKKGNFADKNIPNECRQKLKNYIAKGHKIRHVAFPPKGGNSWVIVTDKNTFSRNIPDECHKKIQEFQRKGKKVRLVAFPTKAKTGNSWVVLNTDGTFFARNIDDECYQILRNLRESDMPGKKAARKITHISFAPNGGFVVLADDYHFARNIDDACFSKMNSFRKNKNEIKTVVFDSDGKGWSIISNKKSGSRPIDRIRKFEGNVAGTSIWKRMRELNVPGVSIGVVINGKLAWSTAYGHLRNGDRTHAVHPESMFQAASISKVMAAVGIHKLVDQNKFTRTENLLTSGKLKWNIPIHNNYKTRAWAKNFEHLTINNILKHRSGIEGRASMPDGKGGYLGPDSNGNYSGGGYGGYEKLSEVPSLKQLMEAITITYSPLIKPNNRKSWYSGKAFTVLQKLTKDVTNTDYSTWMKTNVLNPMGMQKSRFTTHPEKFYQKKDLTFGYYTDTRRIVRNRYPEYAAAGLYTNAKELANLIIMLNQSGTINSKKVLTVNSANSIRNGNGTITSNSGGKKEYSHGGTNEGYRTFLVGLPVVSDSNSGISSAGIVVLTNGNTNSGQSTPLRGELVDAIKDAYGW